MNNLQLFENPEFGKIRTLEEDGKVLFCGKDVAKALGYSNPRDALSRHCRGVVKRDGVSETVNQHGKATEQIVPMSFIPESDVYRLITHSKLETAQRFEAWVFEEVLPAIRKTGGYQLAPAMSQQQKQLDALQKIQFILDVQAKKMEEDRQAATYWQRAYRDKREAVKTRKQNIAIWRKIFRKVLDGDVDCLAGLEAELPSWYDQAKAISTARYPTFEECMDILTAPIEEDEE